MSRENVEIVRRAWEVGAAQGLEAVADLFDRNIECSPPESAPTAGTYRGLDEIKLLISEWSELFEDFGFDPERFIDAGDRVIVFGQQRGRGKTSGVDIGESQAHVYTVRNGKIVRWLMFHDRGKALESAELSEQDAHADS